MPRLGVTLGDPAGVGPEVCEGALSGCRGSDVTLFGPAGIADAMAERLQVAASVQEPFAGPRGEASAASGRAALAALAAAIGAARSGEIDALVTAPISKEALALAGSDDLGHTWLLARELGAGDAVAMAFVHERLRVILASDHVPLRRALDDLSGERILQVTEMLRGLLVTWGRLPTPRLALAGLNPHAGEGGILGREEEDLLVPVVTEARHRGIDLSGPHPADSLFRRAYDGDFDGVVALYHDQALIPVKMLGLDACVNVTLGLSLPRTSPGHGTAFDRVGTDTVSAEGMRAAVRLAFELAPAH
jgi:4-hydroxythreonine-4-phosphate dehydrogenase